MSKFALKDSDIKAMRQMYNLVATGQTARSEKRLGRHRISCYAIPKFDPNTIRIDIKSLPGGQHD